MAFSAPTLALFAEMLGQLHLSAADPNLLQRAQQVAQAKAELEAAAANEPPTNGKVPEPAGLS